MNKLTAIPAICVFEETRRILNSLVTRKIEILMAHPVHERESSEEIAKASPARPYKTNTVLNLRFS